MFFHHQPRRLLADEESRVSYWRRLLQARSDIVGGTTLDTLLRGKHDSVAAAHITVAGNRIDVGSGAAINTSRGTMVDAPTKGTAT